MFGAAAAVGKLLKLNEQQMTWALGLAASQPVGLRRSFGSMNKSFNPGRAASSGIFAAILASKNFTSSDAMIEAKRGWANTISTKQDYNEILGDLGKRYEAALNTYKPFACGIVMHPAIDAAIQLRNENKVTADQIERVDLKVHPLVLELTGKKTPQQGLEGKFSIYHAVAVAIVEGAGGEKQFSDRAVTDPTIVALRGKVNPVITPGLPARARRRARSQARRGALRQGRRRGPLQAADAYGLMLFQDGRREAALPYVREAALARRSARRVPDGHRAFQR